MRFMKPKPAAWPMMVERLKAGADLVPAIIDVVFLTWPKDPLGELGFDVQYQDHAPEVGVLRVFRDLAGNRVLGSWTDVGLQNDAGPDAWCATHTVDDAIELIGRVRVEIDGRPELEGDVLSY